MASGDVHVRSGVHGDVKERDGHGEVHRGVDHLTGVGVESQHLPAIIDEVSDGGVGVEGEVDHSPAMEQVGGQTE